MLSRRQLIQSGLSLAAIAGLPIDGLASDKPKPASAAKGQGKDTARGKEKPKAKDAASRLEPLSITALAEVFGDGQKLTAVTLEYPEPIDTTTLDANSFGVRTRRIRRIYANTTGLPSEAGENGRFVIIELSPKDATAALFTRTKGKALRTKAAASWRARFSG